MSGIRVPGAVGGERQRRREVHAAWLALLAEQDMTYRPPGEAAGRTAGTACP